ncbi:hypothetical protein COLO4_36785 [Corchorus olitorius]|uniref:HAT C-terminal dimerisation domain-containing protein n=1 Tax=Corchorus olitorius TaxID=93759 RepID=A0A1R3G5C6_9ROSI|nr:hypothetical protein COLO4_36785 [Corchorus olitorius]
MYADDDQASSSLLASINEALLALFEDYRREPILHLIKDVNPKVKAIWVMTWVQITMEREIVKQGAPPFDVLKWWRLNGPRFPTLSLLAKDVLVVPVSTVASESAFSIDGRVFDVYRSSITSKIVQALICAQD